MIVTAVLCALAAAFCAYYIVRELRQPPPQRTVHATSCHCYRFVAHPDGIEELSPSDPRVEHYPGCPLRERG